MTTGFVNPIGLPAIIPVDQGGSGANSFTPYAPVIGGTSSSLPLASASSGFSNSGYILTSTGSTSSPTWQAPAGGGVSQATATGLNFIFGR